ncbi:MAG: hypothetical protein QM831_14690 [Kofleriaceae bacterium]
MKAVLVALMISACATTPDNSPSESDITAADQWAETSDGKADLPNTWAGLVAWVKNVYYNDMSAVWNNQEHPASSSAAVARVQQLLAQEGVANPSGHLFKTTVRRLRFSELIDHSEINIQLPQKTIRLIGDPKGAGVFVDNAPFEDALSPQLCLNWSEVQTAINASYVAGHYGVDFVCHVVTEKVLRALGIGTAKFSDQIHTYSIARYIWGPILPSFNSSNPSDWPESRTGC